MSNITSISAGTTSQSAVSSTSDATTNSIIGAQQPRDKFLDSVNLTLSPEGIARMKAELAKIEENKGHPDSEEQIAAKAKLIANRQAMIANETRIDISEELFTDPVTSDRALRVSALIGFASKADAAAVADAVHAAIASPVRQWTDTTEAVDIATQQMKLNTIIDQMIPADKQARAHEVVNKYITSQVEQRDASTLQGFEHLRDLRTSLGDTASANAATGIIEQIKQGTYKSQDEMRQALSIAKSLDFTSRQTLDNSASAAFGQFRNLVETSMPGNAAKDIAFWVSTVGDFQQNWQAFEETVAKP